MSKKFWQGQKPIALNLGGAPEPQVTAGKSRVRDQGLSQGESKQAVLGSRFQPTTGGALQRTKRLPYPIPGES